MRFFKMQMLDGSSKINYVDEVLADDRITADIDYAGDIIEDLLRGDIIMIHKGNQAHCIVKVISKVLNKSTITGASFGVDYKVDILSYFSDLPTSLGFVQANDKVGPNGTFTPLMNPSKTKKFVMDWYNYITNNSQMNTIQDLLISKKQIILQGPPGTGKTRLAKEIAHQLIFDKQAVTNDEQKVSLSSSEQFEIVQFHASYSYEDFVRGISVENIDGNIIYETKNRILGEIASKANKNYLHSNEDLETSYQELFLDEAFDEFVAEIAEKTEGDDQYDLTDNISIISLDEDAFRYKGGNGWSENGNRMKFADIKQAFKDGNVKRQDVKKNKNLASMANWHSSYYVRVLNDFQKYWDENLVENEKKKPQHKVDVKNYVLIIDEINRANLSSVLGELIYALEYRGEPVESIYEIKGKGREIILPENLFIIGTMNTADRSVGHIDYAIRRRFAFESVLPQDLTGQLEGDSAFAKAEFDRVKALFVKPETEWERSDHLSEEFDPKDVCIGHSYFICEAEKGDKESDKYKKHLKQRLDYEIKPILEEYIKDGVLKDSPELSKALKEL